MLIHSVRGVNVNDGQELSIITSSNSPRAFTETPLNLLQTVICQTPPLQSFPSEGLFTRHVRNEPLRVIRWNRELGNVSPEQVTEFCFYFCAYRDPSRLHPAELASLHQHLALIERLPLALCTTPWGALLSYGSFTLLEPLCGNTFNFVIFTCTSYSEYILLPFRFALTPSQVFVRPLSISTNHIMCWDGVSRSQPVLSLLYATALHHLRQLSYPQVLLCLRHIAVWFQSYDCVPSCGNFYCIRDHVLQCLLAFPIRKGALKDCF